MRDLSTGPSLLSVNTATVRKQAGLLEIIEACARHGIAAISPWRDQVAAVGLEQAARDEAAALGAPCVILVAGGLPQFARPGSTPSKDLSGTRKMIEDGIAELLVHARQARLPLALEPLHPMYAADRAAVNTLGQALDIADRLDPGGAALGVAVDVYHTWWDPELYASIARAGRDKRLIAYHVCDWLVPTKDMLNDRGMMGDGVVDLRRIRRAVEDAGYTGLIEAEIFSDYWWAQPIDRVLATCVERYRTVV
jgi:sugar phosphate isomerase/epimerase